MISRRSASAAVLVAGVALCVPSAAGAATGDYSSYLGGPAHHSYNRFATAITVTNAASLHARWTWTADAKAGTSTYLNGTPATFAGVVYLGSSTGDFYAVNATTGKTIWKRTLPSIGCHARGITSSATVQRDPKTGLLTVYVGAGDHYLYALNAQSGATVWRTLIGGKSQYYYNWSSPTVLKGTIYYGVGSNCDKPLAGGVIALSQTTGKQVGRWFTGGKQGAPGATVYTSVAADGSRVFATTGDSYPNTPVGDGQSIVALSPVKLKRLDGWMVPDVIGKNSDFNASPTIFSAGTSTLVGACNKNNTFYVWRHDNLKAGPLWSRELGVLPPTKQLSFCGGSAVFTPGHLYMGSSRLSATSADQGSAFSLDPATGAVRWSVGLPKGPVIGSPTLNGSGVLAFPTYNLNAGTGAVYLLDADTGEIVKTIASPKGPVFAQPVFSQDQLLVAGPSLRAFGL